MSQLAISKYLNELSDLRKVSGSARETVVREAFKDLLKAMGRARDLVFIPEHHIATSGKTYISVDGALLYDVRLPFGYWEAKDEADDLDDEIAKKFLKGYPQDNIIFEDSLTAVLIQDKQEVSRCLVDDTAKLEKLLDLFFDYQRPEIVEFRKAVAQFQADLPDVLKALRAMIEKAQAENAAFRAAAVKFLKHAQETINPAVTAEDVREMLIQHILTEEIFSKVFDEDDFHRQNNVAKKLYALEGLFFTGALKKNTLKGLERYYNAIRTTAHQISTHNERQKFLKVIYEGFYKVYNPKAADRLGVVYTPTEIVRFIVESADWLCEKHFGKSLIDRQVEILDPAAGTGTFVCELLEHFRGQPQKLGYKYNEELHANEVAILPYYVANLNIEATYAAIAGQYAEFPNLCFVDTLDNVAGLGKFAGYQEDLFGSLSEENVARIKRQNARKISVIIGNPPYNANQLNENDNNKNREYKRIDQRIKATYVAESEATKTKAYDMYVRFFRWASDRLKDEGIIAFVSNNSFVDALTLDGFRKVVAREFDEIWIIDLKGNARTSGERRRQEAGNIFEDKIWVGVAVYFCVKTKATTRCKIRYQAVRDYAKADEKLEFLLATSIGSRQFDIIVPDANGTWIKQANTDFATLMPIECVGSKNGIFRHHSIGVSTNRDEWVTDFDAKRLVAKVRFFASYYNEQLQELGAKVRSLSELDKKIGDNNIIKWSEAIKRHILAREEIVVHKYEINQLMYRPFVSVNFHTNKLLSDRLTANHCGQFGPRFTEDNCVIAFSGNGSSKPFQVLSSDKLVSVDWLEKTQVVARSNYGADGSRVDNITDWALDQFRAHYVRRKGERAIAKDAIFHYVYAVLHDPLYREKYVQNLRREFPRIPFYENFWRWADWGERLMALHIGYESVEPWPLARTDVPDAKAAAAGLKPKPSLRADHDHGIIVLDSETQLSGVPAEAWAYKLGNRSALEWILDQHKEKTSKDPTIREKFNTYRFADYKEKVVDLLARVTRVSVETMAIVDAMRATPR